MSRRILPTGVLSRAPHKLDRRGNLETRQVGFANVINSDSERSGRGAARPLQTASPHFSSGAEKTPHCNCLMGQERVFDFRRYVVAPVMIMSSLRSADRCNRQHPCAPDRPCRAIHCADVPRRVRVDARTRAHPRRADKISRFLLVHKPRHRHRRSDLRVGVFATHGCWRTRLTISVLVLCGPHECIEAVRFCLTVRCGTGPSKPSRSASEGAASTAA